MPKHFRERDRSNARRSPIQQTKPRVLVLCEGVVTEPQYLISLATHYKNSRIRVEIAPEHGVPKTLVEHAKSRKLASIDEAKRQRDSNLNFEHVWCVFDSDDHPHVPDALQMARDNEIKIALSNPCFELWLLLHFQEQPGMQDRVKIRQMLKEHRPEYDKSVNFDHYRDHHLLACLRAERLEKSYAKRGHPISNPSTGVYRLVNAIREEPPSAPDDPATTATDIDVASVAGDEGAV